MMTAAMPKAELIASDQMAANVSLVVVNLATLFTATQIRAACDKCHQLTHDQLDMVVMGQLRSSCRNDRVTLKSKVNNTVRQRSIDSVPLWWPPYLPHFLPLSTCNGH